MASYRRFVQVLALILLTLFVAITPPRDALGQDRTAVATPAGVPAGSRLLRASLSRMEASLYRVHAQQQFHYVVPRQRIVSGSLRGACIMNAPLYRLRVRYTVTSNESAMGPVQVIILTTSGRRTRIWERSSQTGGRWHRDDSDNGTLIFIYLCPASPFFLAGCVNQQCTSMRHVIPDGLRNLGPATVRGFSTWHLRTTNGPTVSPVNGSETHGTALDDFYVDRTSLFLVRWIYRNKGNTMVTDYSRFNQPMTINAPRAGSRATSLIALLTTPDRAASNCMVQSFRV